MSAASSTPAHNTHMSMSYSSPTQFSFCKQLIDFAALNIREDIVMCVN